jgi:ribonuclease E
LDGDSHALDWADGNSQDLQDVSAGGAAGALGKTRRRRRGSRGGRGRHVGGAGQGNGSGDSFDADDGADGDEDLDAVDAPQLLAAPAPLAAIPTTRSGASPSVAPGPRDGTGSSVLDAPATPPSVKPKIGDTRPGSPPAPKRRARKEAVSGRRPAGDTDAPMVEGADDGSDEFDDDPSRARSRRQRRRRVAGDPAPVLPTLSHAANGGNNAGTAAVRPSPERAVGRPAAGAARAGGASGAGAAGAVAAGAAARALRPSAAERLQEVSSRRGGEKRNRPLGRYLMVVHVGPTATQIAVLEGRTLIEHYVSRPADDATQIDGNIYLGRVQNVLPGMEAAFVDIGTPKNAVLYRGDLRYDDDEVGPAGDDDSKPTRGRLGGVARDARIEQLLHTWQNIICQVTKNPIGTKGARLTQEVSLPGRFVVLIPDSDTYGISKRLGDDERKRLRKILDDIRPPGHGLIVRTAAEGASADELGRDVGRLMRQWESVQQLARTSRAPHLLYREPDLAVRVIREEFNRDYRGVVIDDARLYDQVKEYVASITPELADRVELVDPNEEALPLFERFRVHEQVHKALDRKVWLPSGGSLIIERTEALTVIDVNTGKNVGTSNLEETVFRNNLEAAEEIARQLRLRDIGGIIVIDFIDMEVMANRAEVIRTFREALARDKTRSQVFDISELGLVEMTRKRISEGLVESYSETCPTCAGRGIVFDESLL